MKRYTKVVHEGSYVAEVDVDLIYADEGWSPYLSLEDAFKLDEVREAFLQGDVKSAARFGRIYTLEPLLKIVCRIVLVLVIVIVIESMRDQSGIPRLFLANALTPIAI